MKIFYRFLIFFIFSVYAVLADVLKDQTALIVIDMQPGFVTRNPHNEKVENYKLVQQVIKEQQTAIEYAKSIGLPIVFIEYANYFDTTSELKNLVENYGNKKFITKSTDGMFDPFNTGLSVLKKHLDEKGIKTLIITGANGGACVLESIKGAVLRNYNVLTYTKGIADFNYEKVMTPYRYFEIGLDPAPPCENCVFAEYDDLSEIAFRLTQEVDLAKKEIKINQTGRNNSQKATPDVPKPAESSNNQNAKSE